MEFTMIQTGILSIFPPLIAITLALITKEVYSSLFVGILSGMFIYVFGSGEPFIAAFAHLFDMMYAKIADNAYMIIFLALLWAVVSMVAKSGGSEAYGRWAGKKLKTRRSTSLATALLGVLIFIDDGFNCLTVGTVMRPIYDRHQMSREKLAYLIDATAAPICIIAPVSSWAVAVASEVSETNGFHAFLATIPYNFYALLTLIMVFVICVSDLDFGPMKKAEEKARKGEITQMGDSLKASASQPPASEEAQRSGRVLDLVLPIAVLIVCAILGMAYVGGFFSGVPFSEAIGENPTGGLTLGAFAGLVTAFCLYIPRRLMTPRDFINTIVTGIGNIVPPMLILILSWSLGGVCREMIGTGLFISGFINDVHLSFGFLPFLIFIVASVMSFAMGTSWGTFGMLIPIVSMICSAEGGAPYLIPMLGATLAGSVFGDHCSPISDTTILSSTGAQCEHINHVETQIPYAVTVAVCCAIGYLIAGFVLNPWIPLAITTILLIGTLIFLSKKQVKIPQKK